MGFFQIEWKMNVPNFLSLIRIVLLPVFAVLYLMSAKDGVLQYWAFGVLVLSGITDSLDGIIARKFNKITDLGKLLDPLADKLTQVVVVLCLALRHSAIIPLLVICFIKELCQTIGGLILLRKGEKIRGARWFGKVATFTLYGFMALVVLWPNIPLMVTIILVAIVAALMLFAFFQYMRMFFSIKKTMPQPAEPVSNSSLPDSK